MRWMLVALFVLLIATIVLTTAVRLFEPRVAFFPERGEDATPADLGVTFEPSTITTGDHQQLRVWSLPHPQPRATILYFHGNGGNLSVWMPILVGIQQQGYTVHALDYRVYGLSTGAPSERGLYADVAAFVASIGARADRGGPVVYWGRSLGGAMAARAATLRKPDGVIVEAGFPDALTLMKGSPLALLGPFSSYRFPTARFLSDAQVPVLVMHGDADRVVPFANGRTLFEGAPQPKSLHVITGGDHNDPVPADPVSYWQAVAQFIEGLRSSGTQSGPKG